MAQWRELIRWLGDLSEHGLQMAVLGRFSSDESTLCKLTPGIDPMATADALGLFVLTHPASPRPCRWSHMTLPPRQRVALTGMRGKDREPGSECFCRGRFPT